MKLMVRVFVVALVSAGAAATALTPKASANTTPTVVNNPMVISSAIPFPSCNPGDCSLSGHKGK